MTKKWIAINLLLLGITGLLGWQFRLSVRQFNDRNNPGKLQPAGDMKQKLAQEKIQAQPAPVKAYLPPEFAAIPEKNIFSETRAREEKPDVVPLPEVPPLLQKPILVGVTITDSQRRALIFSPVGAGQDRNRRAEVKRIGDVYQGYTITAITSEHIVLESGTRREIIPLHEGSKRGTPGKTAILSTRVVPIGGSAASGGTPVTIVAGSGARTATVPVSSAASPAAAATNPSGGVSPRQAVPTASQPTGQPTASQPTTTQPTTAQPTSPQIQTPGGRVIRTPFGDVVRPNRN
jgi:hypothetical protein